LNQTGAHLTLQNATGRVNGSGLISNAGLITGDGTLAVPVNNGATGEIRAEAGKTLFFTATPGANAGNLVLQGGTLDFATSLVNAGVISGRGTLRTAGLTNTGQMAFSAGTTDVRGNVTLTAGATVITTGGGTTTFFNNVVHNGAEIRTSAGSATVFLGAVTGAGAFTGSGTKYFEGGPSPTGPIASGGVTVVEALAAVTADHIRESALTVRGQVVIRPGSQTSQVNSLTVEAGGKLDINDNALIVDHNGASPIADVRSLIVSGYAGGSWAGNGITSSTAAANPATAIGYAEATDAATPGGLFEGLPVDDTAVLVRLTLAGDATLDGVVDFDDLVNLAQNYNTTVSAATDGWWSHCDFTYDGVTDFNDLVKLAQNYNTALPGAAALADLPGPRAAAAAGDWDAALAAVPEPASLPFAAAIGLLAHRRPRRRRSAEPAVADPFQPACSLH
jgi:hypothetical protein